MQADTEHQENHADLGELLGQLGIGDEAGRVRTYDNARDEVANERRQPEPMREVPEHQRRGEPPGQCQDQAEVLHPRASYLHLPWCGEES